MDKLQKLREKRATVVAEMRGILNAAETEDRDLTDEETAKYDDLKQQAETLQGQIAREEELAAMESDLDQVRPAVASRGVTAPRGPEARREFENLAEFVHAVTHNRGDQRLANLYHEFDPEQRSEQRMDTGSAGGFAVPTQFRGELMQVDPQSALIRPRAFTIPAGDPPDSAVTMPALDQTGDNPGNVYGGVEVNWIGEGATKPETDAKLREITLTPQEVAGHIVVTDKLLRNWQASSAVIERLMRGAVTSAEDHAFLRGNGIAKPMGIINAPASYVVNRAGSGQISRADINAMTSRILMRGGVPVWLASQSVLPQLQNLRNETTDGDGSLVWNPDLRDNAGNQLLGGWPILWNERSPLLGARGDLVLADLSYYLMKDGSGPFVDVSPHVHFTQNKTVIKIFWNVDGKPWLTEPFKQEGGYEVSPFVVLDVPS